MKIQSINKKQLKVLFMMVLVNLFEFFDLFIIGFIISLIIEDNKWNLLEYQVSLILVSSGIGVTLGYFVFGFLSDRFGRLKIIISCIFLISISNFSSCFIVEGSWLFLVIFRFFVGFASGGINVTSIPYLQEFISVSLSRGFFSGLVSVFVPFGLFLGSLVTYYFSDFFGWRGLFFLASCPIFLLYWLNKLPESPYFLQLNKKRCSIVFFGKISNFFDVIRLNKFTLVTVSIGSFCFTTNSVIIQSWGQVMFHDLLGWDKSKISGFFIIISFFSLFSRFFFSLISDSFERKNILFTCGIIGSLGCFIISVFLFFIYNNSLYYNYISFLFSFGILLIMIFGDGAFSIINTFASEIFDVRYRSVCLGFSHGFGSISKILGPMCIGYLYSNDFFSKYSFIFFLFLFFSIFFIIGGFSYFFSKKN